MPRKRKYIYCTECGKKTLIENEKCPNCKKKLDEKDHLLKDYILDHLKDDVKGKVTDKVLDIIKSFIIEHMYGTIMLATILFTITSAVINERKITQDATLVNESIIVERYIPKKCEKEGLIDFQKTCPEKYTLVDEKCIRDEVVSPNSYQTCPDGFFFDGSTCVSNISYNQVTTKSCEIPAGSGPNAFEAYEDGGECWLKICDPMGWVDGVCNAGSMDPIDFTYHTYCENGSYYGNECKTFTNPTTEYGCSEGTLENNECRIKDETDYTITCEEGYTYNEMCKKCEKES